MYAELSKPRPEHLSTSSALAFLHLQPLTGQRTFHAAARPARRATHTHKLSLTSSLQCRTRSPPSGRLSRIYARNFPAKRMHSLGGEQQQRHAKRTFCRVFSVSNVNAPQRKPRVHRGLFSTHACMHTRARNNSRWNIRAHILHTRCLEVLGVAIRDELCANRKMHETVRNVRGRIAWSGTACGGIFEV